MKDGLTPIQWPERYLSVPRYAESSGSQHELRVLTQMLESALCYDQLNISSLCCFEILARRRQLILAAHEGSPLAPDYRGAERLDPSGSTRLGVAPTLSRSVARQMKDKAEIEATKNKARDVRTTPDSRRTPNKGAKGGAKGDDGG